mgnify:CR=1 FL=1
MNPYPGAEAEAQAQFDLAWDAHESKSYAESSRMLTEHLALYDKNTDNRGRAGYRAARDSERKKVGNPQKHALQKLCWRVTTPTGTAVPCKAETGCSLKNSTAKNVSPDSLIARAVANLKTVTVAEETAGAEEEKRILKADQLSNIGLEMSGRSRNSQRPKRRGLIVRK